MAVMRLDLSAWVTRLKAVAAPIVASAPSTVFQNRTLKVYGPGERDLKSTFGLDYPAVYVLRQRIKSTNAGGATRGFRQTYDCYVETTCVAEKSPDGVLDGEIARQALCDAVYTALFGWAAPNATLKLDLNSYADGDPADVVNYGVHEWHTQSLFQGF